MKMIDLLNKIAKGKIPKTIVYNEIYFTYDEKRQNYFSYDDSEIDWKYTVMEYINDEVEIIEEPQEHKIPERLETYKDRNNTIFLDDLCYKYMPIHKDSLSLNEQVIVDKLNEVLDYLKSKGDE